MRTAITAKSDNINSVMDEHFGRALYFAIYDDENNSHEFIKNPFYNDESGVGENVVSMLLEHGVDKIIAKQFGVKIKDLLDPVKVQMIVVRKEGKKISDIIKMLSDF